MCHSHLQFMVQSHTEKRFSLSRLFFLVEQRTQSMLWAGQWAKINLRAFFSQNRAAVSNQRPKIHWAIHTVPAYTMQVCLCFYFPKKYNRIKCYWQSNKKLKARRNITKKQPSKTVKKGFFFRICSKKLVSFQQKNYDSKIVRWNRGCRVRCRQTAINSYISSDSAFYRIEKSKTKTCPSFAHKCVFDFIWVLNTVIISYFIAHFFFASFTFFSFIKTKSGPTFTMACHSIWDDFFSISGNEFVVFLNQLWISSQRCVWQHNIVSLNATIGLYLLKDA